MVARRVSEGIRPSTSDHKSRSKAQRLSEPTLSGDVCSPDTLPYGSGYLLQVFVVVEEVSLGDQAESGGREDLRRLVDVVDVQHDGAASVPSMQ
jgi:hypothetical protein